MCCLLPACFRAGGLEEQLDDLRKRFAEASASLEVRCLPCFGAFVIAAVVVAVCGVGVGVGVEVLFGLLFMVLLVLLSFLL